MSEREAKLKQLFLLAQAGNESCYREFLDSVSRLLRAYLMKTMNPRLRSKEQVEDLVQEILISIHRKRDLFESDRPLLPWLYAVARYRLIDSLRAHKRRPECTEWIEKFDALAFTEMPKLGEEEDGAELLDGLSERQKEVLKMAKVDEVSIEEISQRMGMSLSSVKVTIHRSIKILRKKMSK